MHHFFLKRSCLAEMAPEFSVPAIGCPGTKNDFFWNKFIVFFEKQFLTDPTSVTIELLDKYGKIDLAISSIILTGVQIKITSLPWIR